MKRFAWRCAVTIGLATGAGCASAVTTEPYPVSATAAIERYDLAIPADIEVRTASYSVTGLADVSGVRGSTSSVVQVRPLLTVYGVRRSTGEQLVLIYEDPAQRKQPSRIIRLIASRDSVGR